MFSIFRDARRRTSLARVALLFILAAFVFVGSASAGDVFGVPPAPTPPPGPDDFTDAEVEPTVAPGPDDFTSADPGAPDPDDGFGVPAGAEQPFDAGDDGPAPVGLVVALPATGTGALAEPGDRDLTPLLVLVAASCVLATGLLRSGGDGGNRWGSA